MVVGGSLRSLVRFSLFAFCRSSFDFGRRLAAGSQQPAVTS
jgi:hypothetical protein